MLDCSDLMNVTVLICLHDPAADGLDETLLMRTGLDWRRVGTLTEARTLLSPRRPGLVVLDRDDPGAEAFIREVRQDELTRSVSVVVAARGEFRSHELQLLEAGANAVLRLPPGPEWDERLARLARVPSRRAVRLPVRLQIEGRTLLDLTSITGTVLNLSATGFLVECDRVLDLGVTVRFSFFLPGNPVAIVGQGRVMRDGGAGRFGVEFDRLDGEAAEQMAHLGRRETTAE